MGTTVSFYVQPESNTSYYMTYDSDNNISQSDVSPSTYQTWDFTTQPTLYSMVNPKNTSGDAPLYLKIASDGSTIFQNTFPDIASIWDINTQGGSTYSIKNLSYNKYLGVSDGALTLVDSVGADSTWTQTLISGYSYYTYHVTVSSVNYYLLADIDNYDVTVQTSVDTSNVQFWWGLDNQTVFTIAETGTYNFLLSNGDGTVSISDGDSLDVYWALINVSEGAYILQSMNYGFLTANSDNATMSETISSPVPWPGTLSNKMIFNLIAALERPNPFTPQKIKGNELRKKEKNPDNFAKMLQQLEELGFTNKDKNIEVLVNSDADLTNAIKLLVAQRLIHK